MPVHERSGDRYPWLAAVTCLVAMLALVLQYILLLGVAPTGDGVGLITIRFFSYFTILSNLLVALATGAALLPGTMSMARWFRQARVRGGIALYIGVTGLVYVMILRHAWQPAGMQWWVDCALHYWVPLLYLAWWVSGVMHGTLRRASLGWWLLFPLAFLGWALLRGAWVHEYPYPFLDVDALGVATMARNALGMLVLFLLGGAELLVVDRFLGRRQAARPAA